MKVLLDRIFGRASFMNEIVWAYDYGARTRSALAREARHDPVVRRRTPRTTRSCYDAIDRIPYAAPGLVGPEKAARGKTPTDVWWQTIVPTNSRERTGYADAEAARDPVAHRRGPLAPGRPRARLLRRQRHDRRGRRQARSRLHPGRLEPAGARGDAEAPGLRATENPYATSACWPVEGGVSLPSCRPRPPWPSSASASARRWTPSRSSAAPRSRSWRASSARPRRSSSRFSRPRASSASAATAAWCRSRETSSSPSPICVATAAATARSRSSPIRRARRPGCSRKCARRRAARTRAAASKRSSVWATSRRSRTAAIARGSPSAATRAPPSTSPTPAQSRTRKACSRTPMRGSCRPKRCRACARPTRAWGSCSRARARACASAAALTTTRRTRSPRSASA